MSKIEFLKQNEDKRQRVSHITRVMGYFRPTQSFNGSKQSEYNERTFFTDKPTCCCGN